MRHIVLILFLGSFSAVNFYFAWSPDTARRFQRFPMKSDRALKALHLGIAVLFLLYLLFVIYALLNPRGET